MIHGFRGTHHGLALIADNLSECHVIIPDLPGFGESSPFSDEHNLENYTLWLNNFIDKLNLAKKPILVGHSFGSIITSSYASRFGDSISKLILINPIGAPALSGPRNILTRLSLLYYWLGNKTPEPLSSKILSAKAVTVIMTTAMTKSKDSTVRNFIHKQHLMHFSSFHNAKTVNEAFKTSISHSVRDYASTIKTPTLLIVGDKDDITTLKKQQELANLFPDAQLKIIKNIGHLTHYEAPVKVADFIASYVD